MSVSSKSNSILFAAKLRTPAYPSVLLQNTLSVAKSDGYIRSQVEPLFAGAAEYRSAWALDDQVVRNRISPGLYDGIRGSTSGADINDPATGVGKLTFSTGNYVNTNYVIPDGDFSAFGVFTYTMTGLRQTIASHRNTNNIRMEVYIDTLGRLNAIIRDDALTLPFVLNSTAFTNGNTYSYYFERSGNTLTLKVNDVVVDTDTTAVGAISLPTNKLILGGHGGVPATNNFIGDMWLSAFFPRALGAFSTYLHAAAITEGLV